MYVANSDGYNYPSYDRATLSIVDLNSFTETKQLIIDINLHRIRVGLNNNIYVSSRGNYDDVKPNLYKIDTNTDEVIKKLDVPVTNMTIVGNSLYYCAILYAQQEADNEKVYGVINLDTDTKIADNFITDGTDKKIITPYGIAVSPQSKEIYITDATNFTSIGYLYCFSASGKLNWKISLDILPAHFAFVYK